VLHVLTASGMSVDLVDLGRPPYPGSPHPSSHIELLDGPTLGSAAPALRTACLGPTWEPVPMGQVPFGDRPAFS
jgi:hypothetical protein